MHIIMGILSLVVTVMWIMYLYQGLNRGKCGSRGKWHGMRMRKNADSDVIESVCDPREAAMLLMLGITECGGMLTASQKQRIIASAEQQLGLSPTDANEMFTLCSFMLGKTPSLEKLVKQLAPVVDGACSVSEKQELITMMVEAATADGATLSPEQGAMLDRTKALLKLT